MIMLLFVAVIVLYLYEFTLLSNIKSRQPNSSKVLYLYEFTLLSNGVPDLPDIDVSYTSINLHYSQTGMPTGSGGGSVLYLYEFTLLSNVLGS